MRKTIKMLAALCLATMMLVGCGKDYEGKIVGSWEMNYWAVYSQQWTNGDVVEDWIFTFNKGGKGVMIYPRTVYNQPDPEIATMEFDYSVDDEDLRMSIPEFELCHIERLDDSKMILSQTRNTAEGSQMVVYSFTRK